MTRPSQSRFSLWFAMIFIVVVGIGDIVWAVIIRQGEETFRGYLLKSDESQVVIDEVLPGGKTRRRTFLRSDVRVLPGVRPDRLASLREDEPKGYFNYADELSAKVEDPDARRTAIRLYLIAAYLDPENLGRSSLLAMASLALTAEEERRYRSMAYLLDGGHDPSLLKPSQVARIDATSGLSEQQTQFLRRGLRYLWSGRKKAAANFARNDEFRKALAPFDAMLPFGEFVAGTGGSEDQVPQATLRKAILLELALEPIPSATVKGSADLENWSDLDWRQPSRSTTALSLETITPFDPRKSRYREGEWQ
jgi:hypothetical protein